MRPVAGTTVWQALLVQPAGIFTTRLLPESTMNRSLAASTAAPRGALRPKPATLTASVLGTPEAKAIAGPSPML